MSTPVPYLPTVLAKILFNAVVLPGAYTKIISALTRMVCKRAGVHIDDSAVIAYTVNTPTLDKIHDSTGAKVQSPRLSQI